MTTVRSNTFALLKTKKPREIQHPVVIDEDAVEAYAAARRDLTTAQDGDDEAAVTTAQATADALEEAAEAGVVNLTVRALPRLQFAAIKAAHPPKDEDHERLRTLTGEPKIKASYHAATFQPELVAACVIDPDLTLAEATELAETWNDAEWTFLVAACLRVNQETVDTTSLVFSSGRTRN